MKVGLQPPNMKVKAQGGVLRLMQLKYWCRDVLIVETAHGPWQTMMDVLVR